MLTVMREAEVKEGGRSRTKEQRKVLFNTRGLLIRHSATQDNNMACDSGRGGRIR